MSIFGTNKNQPLPHVKVTIPTDQFNFKKLLAIGFPKSIELISRIRTTTANAIIASQIENLLSWLGELYNGMHSKGAMIVATVLLFA